MSNARRYALLAAVLAAIGAFFALGLGRYLSLDFIKSQHAQLQAWRQADPLVAGAAFFGVYVMVTALSLPGAALLTLAAGAVFGLVWGTLIASFAASLGATGAFLLSRLVLRDGVQARFGEWLAAINAGVEKDGAMYLFTLRLVPLFPFFVINLAMGLTRLPARTFYAVSQLGMLAGTLVYVNAGTQLARLDKLSDVASPAVLLSLGLLGVFPLIAKKALGLFQSRRQTRQWRKPKRFDRNLVVIGGGSAGLVSAYIAAAVKAKVTLVEQHRLGGDCLYTGCVPSKALIRSARFLSQVQRAREFGMRSAQAEFDFAEVMERVQRVVQAIAPHDSVERYAGLGVDVVQGRARIVSPWEVEIARHDGELQRLSTRSIVIATGAAPVMPELPGIEQVEALTSETVWSLRQRPDRLLVLGGGPIGCELAQTFARLGCRVTLVEKSPRLLMREDPDASALVLARFQAEGMDVRLGHAAVRFEVVDGERQLIAEHAGETLRLPFDALLVALGRQARLSGYGLEELGIPTGRTVEVNARLQTRFPNIYAAGDAAGPWQFTHTASHQAWYAAVNALFDPFKTFRVDDRVIPWATFTEPEVARVGLNETEAGERGIPHEVTVYPLDDSDRAIADGEAHGFVKVLTVPGKDRILGATLVGAHAGDLLAEFVLAMKHGIGLNKILGTIHVYPTLAEANKAVAGRWRQAHAPQRLLAWAERFHAWRRG